MSTANGANALPFPGFVDLQVNGFQGVDFSSALLTKDNFRKASRALFETGTVAFLPTVITSAMTVYNQVLPIIAEVSAESEFQGRILGIHLEGPFISSQPGAVGAHRPEHTLQPSIATMQKLVELSNDTVRLITIAAELDGAVELCRWCTTRPDRSDGPQIKVALGHQLASADQLSALEKAGACMLTIGRFQGSRIIFMISRFEYRHFHNNHSLPPPNRAWFTLRSKRRACRSLLRGVDTARAVFCIFHARINCCHTRIFSIEKLFALVFVLCKCEILEHFVL